MTIVTYCFDGGIGEVVESLEQAFLAFGIDRPDELVWDCMGDCRILDLPGIGTIIEWY